MITGLQQSQQSMWILPIGQPSKFSTNQKWEKTSDRKEREIQNAFDIWNCYVAQTVFCHLRSLSHAF